MQMNDGGGADRRRRVGLGEATRRRLHAAGARVVIADLNDERGDALADELGERAAFAHADVTDADSVQAAVDIAAALPGGLRISVCCAGRRLGREGRGQARARTSSSRSRP